MKAVLLYRKTKYAEAIRPSTTVKKGMEISAISTSPLPRCSQARLRVKVTLRYCFSCF
jgi:hypothetical protein